MQPPPLPHGYFAHGLWPSIAARLQPRRWRHWLCAMLAVLFATPAAMAAPQEQARAGAAGVLKPALPVPPPIRPARALKLTSAAAGSVAARLQLDKAFYQFGDTVNARVTFRQRDPQQARLGVYVSAPGGDVELVVLRKTAPGIYDTERSRAVLAKAGARPAPHDGRLDAAPGDVLTGLLMLDPKQTPAGAHMVADMALVGSKAAALPKVQLAPKLQSEEERIAANGARPFGMLAAKGGVPMEIALGEVLFTPSGMADMNAFLAYSGGKALGALPNGKQQSSDGAHMTYRVQVPLERARADLLADLRGLFAEKREVMAAQARTLQTFALILEYRMKGFAVGANQRLQAHGAFGTSELDSGLLLQAMRLTDRMGNDCSPTDATCPLNVPRLWAHMALWDLDNAEVPVAFLDQGFATVSPDFRRPRSGAPFVECDMEATPMRCAPGVANTPPTVPNSGVRGWSWHGTGSVATAGAVLNNGWQPGTGVPSHRGGTAGPAGQVLVPMMYRYGWRTYAFEIGAGIRQAVGDGASCINIAAGYPCNVRLTLGVDFELCDPGARAAACAAVNGILFAAAGATCATASAVGGLFPFLLPPLIEACNAATATALFFAPACANLVALGDTRGPMQAGVDLATASGVPIVASMGNKAPRDLPGELLAFVDLSSIDGDYYRVIPATLPGVIAIGAAVSPGGAPWVNNQIRGASVAVWAPEFAAFFSPPVPPGPAAPTSPSGLTGPVNHSGTSAASSYVTGIVAAMQAANPQLDRRTPGLTPAQRAAIPGRIRRILTDTATEMGGAGEPARLTMVNPFRALLAAWGSLPSGFDTMLNFDEGTGAAADDAPEGARRLSGGTPLSGTLINVPGSGGAPSRIDRDFFRLGQAADEAPGAFTPQVTLTFPETWRGRSAGRLEVAGAGMVEVPGSRSTDARGETTVTYTGAVVAPKNDAVFEVRGVSAADDNVYRISGRAFAVRPPDRFDLDNAGNFTESRPNNDVPARAVPVAVDAGLTWGTPRRPGAGIDEYRIVVPELSFHTPGDADWFLIRSLPGAPGRGDAPGCASRLLIALPADRGVRVASANVPDGAAEAELRLQHDTDPSTDVVYYVEILNPRPPFLLKLTAAERRLTDTRYTLDMRFTTAPPPGSPAGLLCGR